jgi:mxaL protein
MPNIARRIALGQEHLSSLREQHLQELATQTGLDYARIDSPSAFVDSLHMQKYARRTPVLSDMGWIPATLAFISLIYCFVVVPWRLRSAYANRQSPLSV